MVTALTAGMVLTAPQASAGPVTVTDLTPAIAPLDLTRMQTADVTVTFRVESDTGQSSRPQLLDETQRVRFAPTTATLTSGNRVDGVWEATATFGSFMDGTHTPRVRVCSSATSCVVESLATDVVIDGSDWPTLRQVRQKPSRLPAGQVDGAEAVGRAVFSSSHDPVKGITVRLVRKRGGGGQAVDTTNRDGQFTSPWPWTRPGHDAARISLSTASVPGVPLDSVALGNPATRFHVARPHARSVVAPDRRFEVRGIVTPGYPASRLGQVQLQVRTENGWVVRDRAHVTPVRSASGPRNQARYHLTTRFGGQGKHVVRVVKLPAMCGGDSCRVARGASKRFSVLVGSRAYLVEAKLSRLQVPVGAVDGVVDSRSRQAFCAWRDMTGQKPSRSGLTSSLLRSVMRAKKLPAPRRADGLYVNKTCQVLLQVKHQKFRRVVWASTGMAGHETPNGTGAIYRKIEGWVESTLYPGAFMLDPMFFFPGRPAIAIHGSVSNSLVHPYPASHGCVRTWRPQIQQIFGESPIGTKVKVYGSY